MIKRYKGEYTEKQVLQSRILNQNKPEYSSSSGGVPTPLLLCNVANWKN